jgi:hypothetical protein
MLARGPSIVSIAALLWAGAAFAQPLPRGQTVESVTTLGDATQTYALYLPSSYSTDRAWPILIGFHPGGRGRAIVDTNRDAAERYGFIVAGSNNSRNGPLDVSLRAATAMFQDLGQRFAVDGARIYLTGHSGGSRVALQIALANKAIAGVIASSAGYPDVRPRASVRFPIFGTAGTEDFNYIEMRMLARPLKSPHRLVIFEGGHTLPPPDVALQAFAWLELQAMASGLRGRDEPLIDRCWTAEAQAVAAAGETAPTVQLLRAMADDFRALRDVKEIEARATELAGRKEIKRALARARDDEDREARMLDDFSQHQADLANDALRPQTLQTLTRLLATLHAQATAADDSPERARARRVLRLVTMNGMERSQDMEYGRLLQQYRMSAQPR